MTIKQKDNSSASDFCQNLHRGILQNLQWSACIKHEARIGKDPGEDMCLAVQVYLRHNYEQVTLGKEGMQVGSSSTFDIVPPLPSMCFAREPGYDRGVMCSLPSHKTTNLD